jgi:hypothetical protein
MLLFCYFMLALLRPSVSIFPKNEGKGHFLAGEEPHSWGVDSNDTCARTRY